MDFNNAIFKIRQENYVYDSSINAENFDENKSSLYYLNNGEYVSASEATYDSSIPYYRLSDWLQIPAIKGTSVWASTSSTSKEVSGVTITGQEVTIYNENPTVPDSSFTIWNGVNGIGQVNSVDGVAPATGNTDVILNAVQYKQQTLSAASQLQVRENIGALSSTLTINGQPVINPTATNASFSIFIPSAPTHIGAATSWVESLKINNKSIQNLTTNPSITLVPSDISAATSWVESLKINNKSIVNLTTSPSITLTRNDIGVIYDNILDQSSTNPVQNSTLYTQFNTLNTKIANLNKVKSVILSSGSWTQVGSDDVYTQTISVSGITITNNTKVDLALDSTAMLQMANDGTIGMYVQNDSSTLKVYAVGEQPTAAITAQLTFTETVTIS